MTLDAKNNKNDIYALNDINQIGHRKGKASWQEVADEKVDLNTSEGQVKCSRQLTTVFNLLDQHKLAAKKKEQAETELDNLCEDEISKLVDEGYKKKKGELVKKFETDKDHFLETVLSYLIHRYKIVPDIDVDELKKKLYPFTKLRIKIKTKI